MKNTNSKSMMHKQNVRAMRQQRGLTLQQVAEGSGVVTSTIYTIEQGRDVRLSVMRKVSKFFGCSIASLWPEPKRKTKRATRDGRSEC